MSVGTMSGPCARNSETLEHTASVVGKLEGRGALLDVDVEDIVVLLALVELLAAGADGIDDVPDLLPVSSRAVPLFGPEISLPLWVQIISGGRVT